MNKAILLSIVLGACATGEPTMQVGYGGGATTSKPRQGPPSFPTRISQADMPSARRIAPRLLIEGPMSAGIDLCVAPTGDTSVVRLRESSGDKGFDQAVLADARLWKYEPTGERSCEQATINYVP